MTSQVIGLDRFQRNVAKFGADMQRRQRAATAEAGALTKSLIETKARPRTGGDLRLSGVGKRGAAVGVSMQMQGGTTSPAALLKPTGPWHFIERDTRRHLVGSRSTQRVAGIGRVAFGSKLLGTGRGGWIATGPWMAGGSKGTAPWRQGARLARPRTVDVFERALRTSVVRSFGG